jgi:hypothetical protein
VFAGIDWASSSGRKGRGRTFVLPLGIPSFVQRYCSRYESKKKYCASENGSSSVFRFVKNSVLFFPTDAISCGSYLDHSLALSTTVTPVLCSGDAECLLWRQNSSFKIISDLKRFK